MAKLIASVLKKLPVPGVEFSSQQYHSGLEVELPEGASDDEIRDRFRQIYALLTEAVDAEILSSCSGGSEGGERGSLAERGGRVIAMPSSRHENGQAGEDRFDEELGNRVSDGGFPQERDGRRDGAWRGDDGRRREWNRGLSSSGGGYGGGNGRSGGNGGRSGPATQAQIKAIFGIAKGQGVERSALMRRLNEQFGVRRVEDLNVREASSLIESLKAA